MIHSLSGGVIAENGEYLFAKVRVEETPCWYVSPFPQVKAGDSVRVPFGRGLAVGIVERTERCNKQTAPIPLNRVREIEEIL